jgi:hypothetical protein
MEKERYEKEAIQAMQCPAFQDKPFKDRAILRMPVLFLFGS